MLVTSSLSTFHLIQYYHSALKSTCSPPVTSPWNYTRCHRVSKCFCLATTAGETCPEPARSAARPFAATVPIIVVRRQAAAAAAATTGSGEDELRWASATRHDADTDAESVNQSIDVRGWLSDRPPPVIVVRRCRCTSNYDSARSGRARAASYCTRESCELFSLRRRQNDEARQLPAAIRRIFPLIVVVVVALNSHSVAPTST